MINAIIFGIIGLVILVVLLVSVVIIIKNVKPDLCSHFRCCVKQSKRQTKVQTISGNKIEDDIDKRIKKSSAVGQYLTLEDHLDTILETPIKKIEKKDMKSVEKTQEMLKLIPKLVDLKEAVNAIVDNLDEYIPNDVARLDMAVYRMRDGHTFVKLKKHSKKT